MIYLSWDELFQCFFFSLGDDNNIFVPQSPRTTGATVPDISEMDSFLFCR